MRAARRCHVLIPGDWRTLTGGYVYDRRLVESLRARGWTVDLLRIDGDWPQPDDKTLAEARRAIAALPDGACVIADGLAFGALGEVVAPHARRLRWVALVHHPLHLETGLDAATARALRERERQALRHAARVVAVSEHTARDVAALGVPRERIAVVEPGNDAVVAPAPAASGPGGPPRADKGLAARGSGVQLLCVATLTPRKAHALLLDALSGLLEHDWTLHCVGSPTRDPALAAALRARTAGGPLAQRVRWHGELSGAALRARYASADLFVLASRHEGFGMVINEALMHGLPIVASRAGALSSTVPAAAGRLVPPGDVGAWRAALRTAITNPALRGRWAGAARRAARALPSWDQQAARVEAVLDGLREAERFSAGWLALREPADAAARDTAAARLLPGLLQRRPGEGPWRVMDLGCGTGANLRWLAPRLGGAQQWLVVDHDAALLRRWASRPELDKAAGGRLRWPGLEVEIVRRRVDLARDLHTLPWQAAGLVTASALLDLVGVDWLKQVAGLAAEAGAALLFSLSVDGRHHWSPGDAEDARLQRLFAAHQRRDKGFGPALGAQAVAVLAACLRGKGYRVRLARSDWRLGPGDEALQRALIDGVARAALEQDPSQAQAVAGWRERRLRRVADTRLRVGHLELLAWPADRFRSRASR